MFDLAHYFRTFPSATSRRFLKVKQPGIGTNSFKHYLKCIGGTYNIPNFQLPIKTIDL